MPGPERWAPLCKSRDAWRGHLIKGPAVSERECLSAGHRQLFTVASVNKTETTGGNQKRGKCVKRLNKRIYNVALSSEKRGTELFNVLFLILGREKLLI